MKKKRLTVNQAANQRTKGLRYERSTANDGPKTMIGSGVFCCVASYSITNPPTRQAVQIRVMNWLLGGFFLSDKLKPFVQKSL